MPSARIQKEESDLKNIQPKEMKLINFGIKTVTKKISSAQAIADQIK